MAAGQTLISSHAGMPASCSCRAAAAAGNTADSFSLLTVSSITGCLSSLRCILPEASSLKARVTRLQPVQGGRLALNDSARVLDTAPLRMQGPGNPAAAHAAKAPLSAGGAMNGAPADSAAAASSYAGAVAPLQEPARLERDPFGRALVPPPVGETPHTYHGLTPRDSARVIEASRCAFPLPPDAP